MSDQTRKPSISLGCLIGYAVGALIATTIALLSSPTARDYNEQKAFKLLCAFTALGAMIGYEITVIYRKALGVEDPLHERSKFFGSWRFGALVVAVIVGSFLIAVLLGLIYGPVR